jgi:hypothetical protein
MLQTDNQKYIAQMKDLERMLQDQRTLVKSLHRGRSTGPYRNRKAEMKHDVKEDIRKYINEIASRK